MSICSVTLTGNNADIIGDALRSVVDEVDRCVVIDTRPIATDGTLQVAELVCGDKLTVWRKPWREDFGVMRTAALEMAAKSHAAWAIWVDTDERIVVREPGAVKALVAAAGDAADAIACWHVSGEYAKERLIRLPAQGRYHGATHEYWDPADPEDRRIARSGGTVRFDELAKTPEQLREKLHRDLTLLQQMMEQEPDEPRWPYYRGDALALLGEKAAALESFLDAMNRSVGWGELRGWAAFRAADLLTSGGDPDGGLQVACHGMALCPYPELLWSAAAACLVAEEYGNAILWAMLCVAAGKYQGFGGGVTRSGHVHPPSLYEGPWDILARAHEAMGMTQQAADARRHYARAKAMREAA